VVIRSIYTEGLKEDLLGDIELEGMESS